MYPVVGSVATASRINLCNNNNESTVAGSSSGLERDQAGRAVTTNLRCTIEESVSLWAGVPTSFGQLAKLGFCLF